MAEGKMNDVSNTTAFVKMTPQTSESMFLEKIQYGFIKPQTKGLVIVQLLLRHLLTSISDSISAEIGILKREYTQREHNLFGNRVE